MTNNFELARRRRNRPSYVCIPCKTRKVKCDKGRPCASCVTNNLQEFCQYELPKESKKDHDIEGDHIIKHKHNNDDLFQLPPIRNDEEKVMISKLELAELQAAANSPEVLPQNILPVQEFSFKTISKTYLNRDLGAIPLEWQLLHDPNAPEDTCFATFMLFKHKMINFTYQSTRFSPQTPNADDKSFLGTNPYISEDEEIDILGSGGFSSVANVVGTSECLTFGWRSTISKQPCFLALRNYVISQREAEAAQPKRRPSVPPRQKKPTFDDKALAANQTNQEAMDYRLLTLDLTNKGSIFAPETTLIERIKAVIPDRSITYKLLARFFRLFIPYYPFINQDTFYREIEKIIGSENDKSDKIDLHLEKRLDLAHIGILLVILRFSYLSFFANVTKGQVVAPSDDLPPQRIPLFLGTPIELNVIEVARECFTQFQKKKKISLEVLQCGMFLWTYGLLSPDEEEGADGGEYIILHGLLVSMAYSLGLHRDPDYVGYATWSEDKKNIGRRIWYYLTIMDFTACFLTGYPLLINAQYYDTKCPSHVHGFSNVRDLEVEEAINVLFNYADVLIKGPLSRVVGTLLDPRSKIKVSQLTMNLNLLEVQVFSLFGRIEDYVKPLEKSTPSYQYAKTMKARISFGLKAFLMLMYLHLQMHYEAKGDLDIAFYYFKKLLWMGLNELVPYFFPMIGKGREHFGESAEKILNPQMQYVLQVCIELSLMGIIRMNAQMYKMKLAAGHRERMANDPEYGTYVRVVKELIGCFEQCARAGLMALSMLSHRYYFAWGVSRSHNYLLKVVTSDDFYVLSVLSAYYQTCKGYSLTQLQEMLEILNTSVNTLQVIAVHCDYLDMSAISKKNPQQKSPTSSTNGSVDVSKNGGDLNTGAKISSQFEDLNFDSGAEIDKLWLRILSERNQKDQDILQDGDRLNMGIFDERKNEIPGHIKNIQNQSDMKQSQQQLQPDLGFGFEPLFDMGSQAEYEIDFAELQTLGVFSEYPLQHVFKG